MIFVDGVPFTTHSSSSTSQPQGMDILIALLGNPSLVSASNSLKANPERKFSDSEETSPERSKCVYIFQREYATVDPAIVDFVGTDEATTCVGIVIRNQKTGMTSVAHMDSPKIVEMGLSQMLALLLDDSLDTVLDVHLIGGFEDVSLQHANGSNSVSESQADLDGYSFPLCSKIVHALGSREEKFHVRTMCVLGHNTRKDSDGKTYPIFNGFVVETATGVVIPASFDRSSRCPDEVVRRIRVSASYEDTSWNGKLLETYDYSTDCFKIAPCRWQWNYLIEHPYWTETFPKRQPRVFARSADGRWKRC
ncbi:protein N-terminal asparagine amidohydrolase isoform X2 [Lotus japonicus]|uniref:protein N-terminal asparagine amidohydrolase isoform X2 n=1 Tax=Lotus japonicus TaxID=34305 RepID=UPI00258456C7|nr:protein N-terminal asparagine amidohydrolase isoform X2 [Lotus japonicus]